MKNQTLSIEQMLHLKGLGIDTSKASMVLIAKDINENEVCWEDLSFNNDTGKWLCESWNDELDEPCKKEAYLSYVDAESGDYDHSYRKDCGVFTLLDIFELLPKEISVNETCYKLYAPIYDCGNKIYIEYILEHDRSKSLHRELCGGYYWDMINWRLLGAYRMLCWCAENGYLNKQ